MTPLKIFMDMSSALTGFSEIALWGTGQVEIYAKTLQDKVPADVLKEMMALWQAEILPLPDKEEAIRELIMTDKNFGPAARNIIVMWYAGQWDEDGVISAESYVQGLVWDAAGAHPQAAKQPGFGTWSLPPDTPSNDGAMS